MICSRSSRTRWPDTAVTDHPDGSGQANSVAVVYQIDQDRQRIHTRCVGEVTVEAVQEHFTVLGRDPTCPEVLDVLLDLSEMTNLPSSDQLGAVTVELARVAPRVRFRHCAIVASQQALFGMARMFEVFAEKYFVATRVCRTLADGERWLDAPVF